MNTAANDWWRTFFRGTMAEGWLMAMPDEATRQEADFVQKVLNLNGTKREVLENEELRRLLLPVLRADFAVCETYEHTIEEPLACPITVFGGLQDNRVNPHDLTAWREQTSNRFIQRMLPGDHFFLQSMRTPLLQLISQELTR